MKKPKLQVALILLIANMIGWPGALEAQTFGEMLTEWDPSWPQRVGLTAVGYSQEQNYSLDNFGIDLPLEVDPSLLLAEIKMKYHNGVQRWTTGFFLS